MKKKKRTKAGFFVLDFVLILLVASCVVSAVFQTQLRAFFGEEKKPQIEITFLVENVTEEARNRPLVGEMLAEAENGAFLGSITSVFENESIFANSEDPEEQIRILTLTCKALCTATETEKGYEVNGVSLKAGNRIPVETRQASFEMIITMVKMVEESVD